MLECRLGAVFLGNKPDLLPDFFREVPHFPLDIPDFFEEKIRQNRGKKSDTSEPLSCSGIARVADGTARAATAYPMSVTARVAVGSATCCCGTSNVAAAQPMLLAVLQCHSPCYSGTVRVAATVTQPFLSSAALDAAVLQWHSPCCSGTARASESVVQPVLQSARVASAHRLVAAVPACVAVAQPVLQWRRVKGAELEGRGICVLV